MESGPTPLSPNDALLILADIEQRAWSSGAIDVEPSLFNSIRTELQRGTITPQEALERAHRIEAGRNDYH